MTLARTAFAMFFGAIALSGCAVYTPYDPYLGYPVPVYPGPAIVPGPVYGSVGIGVFSGPGWHGGHGGWGGHGWHGGHGGWGGHH